MITRDSVSKRKNTAGNAGNLPSTSTSSSNLKRGRPNVKQSKHQNQSNHEKVNLERMKTDDIHELLGNSYSQTDCQHKDSDSKKSTPQTERVERTSTKDQFMHAAKGDKVSRTERNTGAGNRPRNLTVNHEGESWGTPRNSPSASTHCGKSQEKEEQTHKQGHTGSGNNDKVQEKDSERDEKVLEEKNNVDVSNSNIVKSRNIYDDDGDNIPADVNNNEEEVDKDILNIGSNNTPSDTKTADVSLKHAETQTEPVSILCGCVRCKGLLWGIAGVLEKHLESAKQNGICPPMISLEGNGGVTPVLNASLSQGSFTSKHDDKEEFVPLVKGTNVMISLVEKSNLKLSNPEKDPQKILNSLMDIYFTTEDMYEMTCDGKGVMAKELPRDKANAFKAYIAAKYDKDKYNFDADFFTKFVNNKCYLARKAMWKKFPALKEERARRLAARSKSHGESHVTKVKNNSSRKRVSKLKSTPISSDKRHCSGGEEASRKRCRTTSPGMERPTTGHKVPRASVTAQYSKFMQENHRSSNSLKDPRKRLFSPVKLHDRKNRSPMKQKKRRMSFTASPMKGVDSIPREKSPSRIFERHVASSTPKSHDRFRSKDSKKGGVSRDVYRNDLYDASASPQPGPSRDDSEQLRSERDYPSDSSESDNLFSDIEDSN